MKNPHTPRHRAIGLLLAAAALPLTPAMAQDTQPPADTPVVTTPIPAPVPAPVPAPTPPAVVTPPVIVAPPPPVIETEPEPAARAPATTRRSATRTVRTTTRRPPARPRVAAPANAAAPAPVVAATPVADPVLASGPPLAEAPPIAETVPAEAAPVETEENDNPIWPWLLGGLLALGALALLLRRRRRDVDVDVDVDVYEAPVEHDRAQVADVPPTMVAEPEPVAAAPIMAAPIAAATIAPVAAAADTAARPWLALDLRPVRAGVDGGEARVEFELIVDNQGSAPARDVRISTWMVAAGSADKQEMERRQVERPADAALPEVTIDAGHAKRIETAVAITIAGLGGDAMLPVVVADARYRLPDGSEARTSASFAVGVPDGDDLAHFAIDNPSGLHDGVEARAHGEPRRA